MHEAFSGPFEHNGRESKGSPSGEPTTTLVESNTRTRGSLHDLEDETVNNSVFIRGRARQPEHW